MLPGFRQIAANREAVHVVAAVVARMLAVVVPGRLNNSEQGFQHFGEPGVFGHGDPRPALVDHRLPQLVVPG